MVYSKILRFLHLNEEYLRIAPELLLGQSVELLFDALGFFGVFHDQFAGLHVLGLEVVIADAIAFFECGRSGIGRGKKLKTHNLQP